jgi:hypothetical protein
LKPDASSIEETCGRKPSVQLRQRIESIRVLRSAAMAYIPLFAGNAH